MRIIILKNYDWSLIMLSIRSSVVLESKEIKRALEAKALECQHRVFRAWTRTNGLHSLTHSRAHDRRAAAEHGNNLNIDMLKIMA
jgi:hypothetical protein